MKDILTINIIKSIVWGVLGAFILAFAALFFIEVPEGNKTLVDLMLGALIGYVGAIVTFYFGSSIGSKRKDSEN